MVRLPPLHFRLPNAQADISSGDIVYIRILGNPIIILNSREAAKELFENQSSVYSSRPHRTMVNEL